MEFKNSKTKENLMRAFAGESQARNRYNMAQAKAKAQQHYAIAAQFGFTADQEKAHAKVFYEHLKELSGQEIEFCADYPVTVTDDIAQLLHEAAKHESAESESIYPEFAKTAREEGFGDIARDFENIAKIEALHARRFSAFADLLEKDRLYKSDKTEVWTCLNCGFILESESAPEQCPVCGVPQGYYIRLSEAAWYGQKCE